MDIFYVILGFLLIVYEAVNNVLKSVAASVGGEGVLVALVVGFIALTVALNAREKVEELVKKVEELEEKLAEKEKVEELAQKVEELEEKLAEKEEEDL